jgi:oligo-alginate lyase
MPKTRSAFYPTSTLDRMRAVTDASPTLAAAADGYVAAAQPWMARTYDELWAMVVGPTMTRSWMVWSDGHCPACEQSVTMYHWQIDAVNRPWSLICPRCEEAFPKNDFPAYYESGLDAAGIFDASLADRSLLYNMEHPDVGDPLRGFGVDDGEGYRDGDRNWRFIGAYLIYGHWKQLVVAGVEALSRAYVVTQDSAYADRALILLDRVADIYPDYDYAEQGLVYETAGHRGYVSVWHDACEETRQLILGYDRVFEGLTPDSDAVTFLAEKARQFDVPTRKTALSHIQENIETRIAADSLRDHGKLHTNYPREEMTQIAAEATLHWPASRERVTKMLDDLIVDATAVDGVTGEKGLSGYSVIGPTGVADILSLVSMLEETYLDELVARHPRLHDMYRFHYDTLCLDAYYPMVGDCGSFARPYGRYAGASFTPQPGLTPSSYTLFWRMHGITGDAMFARAMLDGAGGDPSAIPDDWFWQDATAMRAGVVEAAAQAELPASVNKEEWGIGILRSGEDADRRALWMHYQAGARHGHADGMNLGLFAHGLDLVPELGYPPVQYGGWGSERARWYTLTAAHNTVVVDRGNQKAASGTAVLWADGRIVRGLRAACPELVQGGRYDRTALLIDIDGTSSYVVDVFRVAGGSEHLYMLTSHFAELRTHGLDLSAADDMDPTWQMRSYRADRDPSDGWHATFHVEDRYELLNGESAPCLRYTCLTEDAEALTAEGWVALSGLRWGVDEAWIPRLLVRRSGADLSSNFVGILEPYVDTPRVVSARRLGIAARNGSSPTAGDVALEVTLADGRRDVIVALDADGLPWGPDAEPVAASVPEAELEIAARLGFVRYGADGAIEHAAAWHGQSLQAGSLRLDIPTDAAFAETDNEA